MVQTDLQVVSPGALDALRFRLRASARSRHGTGTRARPASKAFFRGIRLGVARLGGHSPDRRVGASAVFDHRHPTTSGAIRQG